MKDPYATKISFWVMKFVSRGSHSMRLCVNVESFNVDKIEIFKWQIKAVDADILVIDVGIRKLTISIPSPVLTFMLCYRLANINDYSSFDVDIFFPLVLGLINCAKLKWKKIEDYLKASRIESGILAKSSVKL